MPEGCVYPAQTRTVEPLACSAGFNFQGSLAPGQGDDCFLCERVVGGFADCAGKPIVVAMVAGHVELALFEQTFASPNGMNQPFRDRVADAAEKTDGAVLFDVRVDGEVDVQRMAAIGYGTTGLAIIVMDKNGQLRCASVSVNGDMRFLADELAGWYASPLSEQAHVEYHGTAVTLLAKLRSAGHFVR